MRHIKDPRTGKCLVCESGKAPHGHSHGPNGPTPADPADPRAQPMWDDVRKKIIYVNAFSTPSSTAPTASPKRQGSPGPRREKSPGSLDNDSGRGSTAASASQVQYNPRSPSPSRQNGKPPFYVAGNTGPNTYYLENGDHDRNVHSYNGDHYHGNGYPGGTNVHYVDRGYPGNYLTTSPQRSPSPRRDRDRSESPDRYRNYKGDPKNRSQSPGRYRNYRGDPNDPRSWDRRDPQYGYKKGYRGDRTGYNQGSAFHEGSTFQGAQWGKRRTCTVVWAILLLLLLAGIAVGLYFLITYLQDRDAANDPQNTNPGGTYVNGVYVLQSTANPEQVYFVYGTDIDCNPYDNNTIADDNITYPNCNSVTTSIRPVTYTTTTIATTTTLANAATSAGTGGLYALLVSYFIFYIINSIGCKVI